MTVSTFLGVETALRAILAQQQALDITGHNIANANTPGYTRQIAQLKTTPAFPTPSVDALTGPGPVGTGVTVEQYQRVRDDFIDVQVRAQMMNGGYYDALKSGLDQVQGALAEPGDNGIQSLLSKFWASWQDLGNNPSSTPARQAVLQAGQALADGFKQVGAQLATFSQQNDANVKLSVDDLNSTAAQIAKLNVQIGQAQAVKLTPNDLLDQRDALLDHLYELGNVTVVPSTASAGQVDVWLGPKDTGFHLVTAGSGAAAPVQNADGTAVASVADLKANAATALLQPLGKIGGLVALGDKIAAYTSSIDGIASNLHDQVNGLEPGFFAGAAGTARASTLAVAITDPAALVTGTTGPGDGSIATAIADLQRQAWAGSPAGTPVVDSSYQRFVTTVGADAQLAARSATNADAMRLSLENRRQSVSGVSLDEEMTNLVKFQRGFQAASRALTAMDDMIAMIITRTGRVGL